MRSDDMMNKGLNGVVRMSASSDRFESALAQSLETASRQM